MGYILQFDYILAEGLALSLLDTCETLVLKQPQADPVSSGIPARDASLYLCEALGHQVEQTRQVIAGTAADIRAIAASYRAAEGLSD